MDMTIRHAHPDMAQMCNAPRAELFTALQSLYRTREYSDLVIFASDWSCYPVHKAVVCPRSDYFRNAVREQRWRDGVEGDLALSEDDPEVVRLVVEYFYLLDYNPVTVPPPPPPVEEDFPRPDSSDTSSLRTNPASYGEVYGTSAISAFGGPAYSQALDSFAVARSYTTSALMSHAAMPIGSEFNLFLNPPQVRNPRHKPQNTAPRPSPLATREAHLVMHAKMYTASVRYGMPGLKALALDKFKLQLTRHWDSSEFASAIAIVYNTTPASDKDMREAVINTLSWHGRLLDKPEIELVVMEIQGLAYELLKRSRRAEPEYGE